MSIEQFIKDNRSALDTANPPDSLWNAIEKNLDEPHSTSLEAFILQNRSAFDSDLPAHQVWENIEKNLHQNTPNGQPILQPRSFSVWRTALTRVAAALALLVAGIGIGTWTSGAGRETSGMAMSQVSNEYAELERFYQLEIEKKSEKLSVFAGQREAVEVDLNQIDATLKELQTELAHAPEANREQIIRAMIANYKTKIAILEKVLHHVNPAPSEQINTKDNERKNI